MADTFLDAIHEAFNAYGELPPEYAMESMFVRMGPELRRRLKALASARCTTMGAIVVAAVEREIREHEMSETQPPSRGERSGT